MHFLEAFGWKRGGGRAQRPERCTGQCFRLSLR
jgi:hypothetical protein